jgi:uncharacterized membrane protein
MKNYKNLPSPLLSLLPIAVLVAMLAITIYLFGSDALGGGSQVCLLAATGMCVFIGMAGFQRKWKDFENAIINSLLLEGVEEKYAKSQAERAMQNSERRAEKIFDRLASNCFTTSMIERRRQKADEKL